MAKVHNLAFDYSAYDNAQEAEAQRAIKYKKNPALKQKTVSVRYSRKYIRYIKILVIRL